MVPTSLTVDPRTRNIKLPVGGTGTLVANIRLDENTEIPEGSIILFTMCKSKDSIIKKRESLVLLKELDIQKDQDDRLYLEVHFKNSDTRGLPPGNYYYDFTLITDPERDENGLVIVSDDSDNVIPIFASKGCLPLFTLVEVTYIV